MAKTIKEMAIEVFPITDTPPFNQNTDEYVIDVYAKRGAYFKGANAVLEEIEKALDTALYELDIQKGYVAVREVIKQLKGE